MTPPSAAIARRNQLVTVAMVFAVFTGFAFVLPFLPLYVRQLGVEEPEKAALWAGVLIGVSPLIAGFLAPVWGRLADRYGHKSIAVKALVAYVALLALCAAVTRVEQLLALRIGLGLFGGLGPLGLAMAAAQAPREDTGRAVGLVQAAQILSAAIGPLSGGLLADAIGMRRTFLVAAGVCALALLFVLAFYTETERPSGSAGHKKGRRVRGGDGGPGPPDPPRRPVRRELHRALLHPDPPPAPRRSGRAAGPPRLGHRHPHLGLLDRRRGLGDSPGPGEPLALAPASPPRDPPGRGPHRGRHGAGALVPGLPRPRRSSAASWAGAPSRCATPSAGSMVPQEIRTTAFGFFSGAALFGGAISPSIAGLIAHVSFRGIYWVDAALYLVVAVVLVRMRPAAGGRGFPDRPGLS